eukprot:TRINITY_DN43913_c0_g1_i1.p1 TRINITY_DN43913_c0_g1~~TRINITY_DN43913_c0_g1_i1.p1  ORF type:complete len:404 (+),score=126.98 TRINITY_DN43913_c0_g1_i1:65-1276(+)
MQADSTAEFFFAHGSWAPIRPVQRDRCEELAPPTSVTAIDFFAGIGGNHYALAEACRVLGVKYKVVAAVEVNDLAVSCYRHNFSDTKVVRSSIEGLKVKDFERLGATLWLMSPPCQPFTRQGLGGDYRDARTRPLFHLMTSLRGMEPAKRPRMLFVENVSGFEKSHTRWALMRTLSDLQYSVREFLLSPASCGVPNSRLRYYLIAWTGRREPPCPGELETELRAERPGGIPSLREFLERPLAGQPGRTEWSATACDSSLYLTPEELLKPQTKVLDVVTPASTGCCCFTKGYRQYFEGTGSVLCCSGMDAAEVRGAFAAQRAGDERGLVPLRLRYFSPREVALLLCFPCEAEDGPAGQGELPTPRFTFASHLTPRQRYRLLGNSVSTRVVAGVLELLLGTVLEL